MKDMNSWEFEQEEIETEKKGLKITYGWVTDFLEKINKQEIKGFHPTGSDYFGLANEKSDIDFIVKRETWRDLIRGRASFYGKRMNAIQEEKRYEFESIRFVYNNKIFNFIIVPNEIEYRVWVQSTNAFMLLLENRVIKKVMKNKNNRVQMFEILKNIFRGYYGPRK